MLRLSARKLNYLSVVTTQQSAYEVRTYKNGLKLSLLSHFQKKFKAKLDRFVIDGFIFARNIRQNNGSLILSNGVWQPVPGFFHTPISRNDHHDSTRMRFAFFAQLQFCLLGTSILVTISLTLRALIWQVFRVTRNQVVCHYNLLTMFVFYSQLDALQYKYQSNC